MSLLSYLIAFIHTLHYFDACEHRLGFLVSDFSLHLPKLMCSVITKDTPVGQFILLILAGKVQCTFVIPCTLKSRKGAFNRMYFHHTLTSAVCSPTLPLPCQCQ